MKTIRIKILSDTRIKGEPARKGQVLDAPEKDAVLLINLKKAEKADPNAKISTSDEKADTKAKTSPNNRQVKDEEITSR